MVKLRINEILRKQNKSKYWLWKKLDGISYQNLNNIIENKTAKISFESLDIISKALSVPVGLLFEQTYDESEYDEDICIDDSDLSLKSKLDFSTYDNLGNKFDSVEEKCKAYNIASVTYYNKKRNGASEEEALSRKNYKVYDPWGNEFKNTASKCNFHKITYRLYRKRINMGWSEKATLLINNKFKFKHYTGINNIEYYFIKELNEYITIEQYADLIEKGELAV